MTDLADKKIIITGAASGIGRATSIMATSRGASVLLVDVADNIGDTADLIRAQGGQAIAVQADICKEDAVKALVASCVDEFGGIDGIYANAGISGARKSFLDLTPVEFQKTLEVNILGTFNCIKHVASQMVTQKSGSNVCTASVAGLRANAGGVDYSASKAAIISMTQTIAYQLYGTDVRINAICPGLIETGMTA
jgi:NAD(P)-dependent dehydrogenase (short-subunit alcohol dehydrogenase family)